MSKNKKKSTGRISYRFRRIAGPTKEYLTLRANLKELEKIVPDGDGRPILFFPGFGAGDYVTGPMRKILKKKGYYTYSWSNGVNLGPSEQTVKNVKGRLDYIHKKHNEKVTLVGHSLGGVLARELSRDFPHKISQVITLGSPFGIGQDLSSTHPLIRHLFNMIHGPSSIAKDEQILKQLLVPPPVPTTSILTRLDQIVDWKTCVNPKAKYAETIEVNASHTGLIFNQASYIILADRLGQDVNNWKPFNKKLYPDHLFYKKDIHEGYKPKVCQKTKKRPHRPIFKI